MISQTLASVLGLFQRMISKKVDDFPNLGFRPGKCLLPQQNDSQAFFLLRGGTAG
jgi:hypothetical protein